MTGRTSIREELDRMHPLGDVTTAVESGRRRARGSKSWVAVGVAAATVVALSVSIPLLAQDGADPTNDLMTSDRGRQPDDFADPAPVTDRVTDWIAEPELVGAPAETDRLISAACPSDVECTYDLVSSDGRIPLRDVSPDLADILSDVVPSDVSVSFDGQWMTIVKGGALRLQSLNPDASQYEPVVLEPETTDGRWTLVGWTSGSTTVVLAEYGADGLPSKYAVVDLMMETVSQVAAPKRTEFQPIGSYGVGPLVGPAEGAEKPARVTSVSTVTVPVTTDPSWEVGQLLTMSDSPLDVSNQMRAGESLRAPDGTMSVDTPPGTTENETVWSSALVYDGAQGTSPSGIIELQRDNPARLTFADPVDGFRLLGLTRSSTAIQVRDSADGSTVRAVNDSGTLWEHDDKPNVTWIVPGLATS